MKKIVELIDSNFDVTIRKPKNFEWVKTNNPITEKTFITDNHIPHYSGGIAWLVEPPVITPGPYEWIKNNNNLYKFVLTYSEELISRGENFLYYPFGNTLLDENHFNLYENEKNKLVSMMVSNKKYSYGHQFRHQCMRSLLGAVDLYGSGITGRHTYKLDSCKNYKFQVVIENSKFEYYFTEKIIDCFLTGVIPIYWGSNKVNEHFDKNGIISFNTIEELLEIINNLNDDEYNKRLESVRNNFNTAKNFFYCEDWIYNNYNFIF